MTINLMACIIFQGDPIEGVPGQPIEINRVGTTVEVTFESEPGEKPEIGLVKTKACAHPGNAPVSVITSNL